MEALKEEIAKEEQADDGKIAKIVDGLVEMVPGAIGAVVSLFATPILGGIAGPVTKFVLDKLKGSEPGRMESPVRARNHSHAGPDAVHRPHR